MTVSPASTTPAEAALYEEIVRRVRSVTDPDRIVLFGSRARGDHRPDSDVDILVVQASPEPPHKRAGRLYTAFATFPLEVDVLVRTPAEIAAWQDVRQAFVTTAIREGRVLYERP